MTLKDAFLLTCNAHTRSKNEQTTFANTYDFNVVGVLLIYITIYKYNLSFSIYTYSQTFDCTNRTEFTNLFKCDIGASNLQTIMTIVTNFLGIIVNITILGDILQYKRIY